MSLTRRLLRLPKGDDWKDKQIARFLRTGDYERLRTTVVFHERKEFK